VLAEWEEWALAVRAFLKDIDRWEIVQPYLASRGLDI
jgi:hypothetical protein